MSYEVTGPLQPYQRLEQELSYWIGSPYVVACSNGTAALHLALETLQLPAKAKVVVPDFTMVACARACTLANLEPVFVDCGDNLLMDMDQLDKVLQKAQGSIKAIMAVHIYGRRVNMECLHELARKYGCVVIEDMAELHGVPPHRESRAACYSFYQNKIVAGEEGGCVAYNKSSLAALAIKLRSLGFTSNHDYQHIPRGHNYRLSNVHASLILHSLANVEANLQERRRAELCYNLWCPVDWLLPTERQVVWVYDLRIPGLTSVQQSDIIWQLNQQGIAARHAFKPMSRQAEYLRAGNPRADRLSREVLYLPCAPHSVTEASAKQCFDVVQRTLATYRSQPRATV